MQRITISPTLFRISTLVLLLFITALIAYSVWQRSPQNVFAPADFLQLQKALATRDDVYVTGTYFVTEPIRIRTRQRIHGNATFVTDGTAFIAEGVHGWRLRGITIRGSTKDKPKGLGLLIRTANRYKVSNVTFQNLETGVWIEPTIDDIVYPAHNALHPYVRGDQGQYTNVSFYENTLGLRIDPGTNAEYNIFTNLMAANNDLAIKMGAGNTIFSGFSITDNKNGVWITGNSPSHAHGVFSGGNINHNTGYNVKITDVSQGQTFTGVHIYGDDETKGRIIIENSDGIRFNAGTIKAVVENNKGAGTSNGTNVVANNYFGSFTAMAGDDQGNLVFKSNYKVKQ